MVAHDEDRGRGGGAERPKGLKRMWELSRGYLVAWSGMVVGMKDTTWTFFEENVQL